MAQKRFHNYQDSVESSRLAEKLAQMVPPGRYGGFNTFNPDAGTLNFGIQHITNPANKTEVNPGSPSINSDLGLMVSNQGVFIEEDDEITGLSVASNAANGWTRYDVVYMEHEHVNIIGGQAATYGVVTGISERIIPSVPDPVLQIPIGIVEIHKNETDLDNATYHPLPIPTLGAEEELIWENLSLNNGWVSGSAGLDGVVQTPQVSMDKQGWVHFRGVIDGSSATSDAAFSLPTRYGGNRAFITRSALISDSQTAGAGDIANLKLVTTQAGIVVGNHNGCTGYIDRTIASGSIYQIECSIFIGKGYNAIQEKN